MPLLERPRAVVRDAVARSRIAPADDASRAVLIDSLEASLFARMHMAAAKVLVLELGVASERKLLAGESPQARFAFFVSCLEDRAFAARLLAQYPVLVSRLVTIIANWQAASVEMLRRLAADRRAIAERFFGGADPGPLAGATALGDFHSGGRAVQRLDFAGGAKLIYKPRPIAMERGFGEFVGWLNARGLSPSMSALTSLDRRAYGYTAHVSPSACADEAAVARFFARQGANIALAYLLGACDLHYENIIAAGEHPIIVDLETLFHDCETRALTPASRHAFDRVADSVTRTLLLPTRVEGGGVEGGGGRGADISALGYALEQRAPLVALDWADLESDEMRMVERHGFLPAADCSPVLDGKAIAAAPYLEEIVRGFERTYDLFLVHKKRLEDGVRGPLAVFRGGAMRRVFRPTSTYVQALYASFHPGLLMERDALDAHFAEFVPAQEEIPRGVLKGEHAALLVGDVPAFRAVVGGKKGGVASKGWEAARARVRGLSAEDRAFQVWIARMRFVDLEAGLARSRGKMGGPDKPGHGGGRHKPGLDERALSKAAQEIGDRLCSLRIEHRGCASWIFPFIDEQVQLAPGTVGFDLYDGLAGIALTLGRLSALTRKRKYLRVAEEAIGEALAIHAALGGTSAAGGFEGRGGLAYALASLGRELPRPRWRALACAMVKSGAGDAARTTRLDVIDGTAGFLLAGLAVAKIADAPALLEELRGCAERLRDGAPPAEKEAGLAHGRAGVGLALYRFGNMSGEHVFRDKGEQLMRRDLEICDAWIPEENAGRDGRGMIAWCRGPNGIALALLREGLFSRDEAAAHVQAIVERVHGIAGDTALCLCHGLLGLIEYLEEAEARGISGAAAALSEMRREAFGRVLGGELCSDHAHRLEAPGLMKGIAGTAYALMRQVTRVPSVLTLEAL